LGGDEFVVLCEDIPGEREATIVGDRIVEALERPFFIAGHELSVAASLGIVLARGDEETPESLLGDADSAMYHAKEHGRGGYEVFNEHRRGDPERLALQEAMRDAPRGYRGSVA
jgi:diguanylate cyclase (GGDEF)-like protein